MESDFDRANRLARFRANPYKVRVAIHQEGNEWVVRVSSRDNPGLYHDARDTRPDSALFLALNRADRAGMDGIDLGMDWAYEHPMKPAPK